jgi:hypothetical protein
VQNGTADPNDPVDQYVRDTLAANPAILGALMGVSIWDGDGGKSGAKGSKPGVKNTGDTGADGGERLLWGSWKDYQKVTIEGREYAQIGDRLYTEHAVNRMQPSGSRYSGGSGEPGSGQVYSGRDAGRSISPNLVDDVIRNGTQTTVTMPNGVTRTVHTSGTVQVVTEQNGKLVVTINPFSGGK